MYVDYINNVHHASEFVINKITLHNRNMLQHLLIKAGKTCKGKCQLYELLYYHLLKFWNNFAVENGSKIQLLAVSDIVGDFPNDCVWFGANTKW